MVIANQTNHLAHEPISSILDQIHFYYTPILVNLGLLGNFMSVCVFFGTKLRHSSCNMYLGALAISDIGFLATIFVAWLTLKPFSIDLFNRSGFCQFFMYLGSLCSFLSVWFVVAFTVERFVAVKWPLRRQSLCTVTRAKALIVKLTIVAVIWCSPILLFTKARPKRNATDGIVIICDLDNDWTLWANVYNSIDAVLSFMLPFTMIVIFNTMIARNVYRLNRTRRTLTIDSDVSNERGACGQHARDRMPQTKVTKMLLLVSTTFFCLNTPSYMLRMIVFIFGHNIHQFGLFLAQHICYDLFNTSFGINFVLYCASGQNFRRAMVCMFRRRSSAGRNGTIMTLKDHEKLCEFTRNLTKRLQSVGDAQRKDPQDSQEIRTISIKAKDYNETEH